MVKTTNTVKIINVFLKVLSILSLFLSPLFLLLFPEAWIIVVCFLMAVSYLVLIVKIAMLKTTNSIKKGDVFLKVLTILSLSLFIFFEFLVSKEWFILTYFLIVVPSVLLYSISFIVLMKIKHKKIESIIFFLSSVFLILAGLTEISYSLLSPHENRLIENIPENTSDLCFVVFCILSGVLIIDGIIKNIYSHRKKKQNLKK